MANPRSLARIAARIKQRVAHCLEFEISDPRAGFITVTEVEVSSDLATAKVLYSVLGTESEKSQVAHMFEDAGGFIQRQVGRVLQTRRIPKLRFFYDDSIERAAAMDAAIREALQRDREINPHAHEDLVETDGPTEPGRPGEPD